MKKLILFFMLYFAIDCKLNCESEEITNPTPDICHDLQAENNHYCCYYEGKNLDTNENEKFCWAFYKDKIDNNKYTEVIEAIEKGTDSHVTKKHSKVELDCFSSYEAINYFLLALIIFC